MKAMVITHALAVSPALLLVKNASQMLAYGTTAEAALLKPDTACDHIVCIHRWDQQQELYIMDLAEESHKVDRPRQDRPTSFTLWTCQNKSTP